MLLNNHTLGTKKGFFPELLMLGLVECRFLSSAINALVREVFGVSAIFSAIIIVSSGLGNVLLDLFIENEDCLEDFSECMY